MNTISGCARTGSAPLTFADHVSLPFKEELFILLSGSVTASIPSPSGQTRLDVFTAGTTFGEIALLDHFPRSADVTANEDIVCRILSRANFSRLDSEMPLVKIKLLQNLAAGLTTVLRCVNLALSVHE